MQDGNGRNKDNFQAEVLQSDKPVLVDFWAAWCGPCKMLSPVVDQIAEENADIKVCKINVDDEPELAGQFGIMSIPTLLVFKGGELVEKTVGVQPKDAILGMLESNARHQLPPLMTLWRKLCIGGFIHALHHEDL